MFQKIENYMGTRYLQFEARYATSTFWYGTHSQNRKEKINGIELDRKEDSSWHGLLLVGISKNNVDVWDQKIAGSGVRL